MHGAGQKSVESNHRRAADACDGIALGYKEEEEEKRKKYKTLVFIYIQTSYDIINFVFSCISLTSIRFSVCVL